MPFGGGGGAGVTDHGALTGLADDDHTAYALADGTRGEKRYTTLSTSKYTATPDSTSILLMGDTSDVAVGDPIEYVDSRGTHRAVIDAVSANTSITINGAPFNVANNLTSLLVGPPEAVITVIVDVAGAYADAADTDLNDGNDGKKHEWQQSRAYLVHIKGLHSLADTGGSQPRFNVRLGAGTVGVCSANSSAGLTLSTAQTFVESGIDIDVDEYTIDRDGKITLTTDAAGTNNNAEGLEAHLTFVIGSGG